MRSVEEIEDVRKMLKGLKGKHRDERSFMTAVAQLDFIAWLLEEESLLEELLQIRKARGIK